MLNLMKVPFLGFFLVKKTDIQRVIWVKRAIVNIKTYRNWSFFTFPHLATASHAHRNFSFVETNQQEK